mgnify:CR=1 FL=1
MFPNRLRELRINKKLTQQDMANHLGISRQGYAKYENDQSEPDYKTIKILASFFNVSADYLLGLTDVPNQEVKFSEHTEKDIFTDLKSIIEYLNTDQFTHFNGVIMDKLDEEDKKIIIATLENTLRLVNRLIKDNIHS